MTILAKNAGMTILAKIFYWLMSILAALLLAVTAVLLVGVGEGRTGNAELVAARTQPGVAGYLRLVRRMDISVFRVAHIGIDHGARSNDAKIISELSPARLAQPQWPGLILAIAKSGI